MTDFATMILEKLEHHTSSGGTIIFKYADGREHEFKVEPERRFEDSAVWVEGCGWKCLHCGKGGYVVDAGAKWCCATDFPCTKDGCEGRVLMVDRYSSRPCTLIENHGPGER